MRPIIAVVGATGTGKSHLAVELAKALNGEIVNADAMQMYQGLDIITNKHPIRQRGGIPHHLLGVEPWSSKLTVRDFERIADKCISEINSRQKLPIVVGGTHYYVQSCLFKDAVMKSSDAKESIETTEKTDSQGNSENPQSAGSAGSTENSGNPENTGNPENPENSTNSTDSTDSTTNPENTQSQPKKGRGRRKTRRVKIPGNFEPRKPSPVDDMSAEQIENELREKDPKILEKFHPNDTRRLRRALEVFYETGKPASAIYNEQKLELKCPVLVFYVYCDRTVLVDRLNARVDKMAELGLAEEVNDLIMEFNDEYTGVFQSIGFRQIMPLLMANEDLQPGIDEMKRETCRYAKQQTKWVKNKLGPMVDKTGGVISIADSSDLNQWDDQIKRSVDIAKEFLDLCQAKSESLEKNQAQDENENENQNENQNDYRIEMDKNKLIPPSLEEHLTRLEPTFDADAWARRRCEACSKKSGKDVIIVGNQWAKHEKSRGHINAENRLKREEKSSAPENP